jgi:YHS domain-containing protein
MKHLLLTAAALSVTAAAALAGPGQNADKKADTAKPVCPVMKHEISKVTADTARSEYKGNTYYFCCEGCKPAFDKDPAKYVKAAEKAKPAKKPGKKA